VTAMSPSPIRRPSTVAKPPTPPAARKLAKRILGKDPYDPDTEPVPVDDLDKKIAKSVTRLAEEIADYAQDIAALTALRDASIATLTALGKQHELGKVKGDGWTISPPVGRSVLKKELLLENGVTVEQIELSTVMEPGKNYSVRRDRAKP
jgi:hypothetical protein